MVTFYIAATDRMSWGRGTRHWEAVAHALVHGGDRVQKVVLFEVTCPDGTLEHDVSVNEMGSITAPAGSTVKDLDTLPAKELNSKFLGYLGLLEALIHTEDNGS